MMDFILTFSVITLSWVAWERARRISQLECGLAQLKRDLVAPPVMAGEFVVKGKTKWFVKFEMKSE